MAEKINPHDLDRVIQVNDDLVSRNIRNFSINYRVADPQGQSFWVNSCCGSYFGEQGIWRRRPLYPVSRRR